MQVVSMVVLIKAFVTYILLECWKAHADPLGASLSVADAEDGPDEGPGFIPLADLEPLGEPLGDATDSMNDKLWKTDKTIEALDDSSALLSVAGKTRSDSPPKKQKSVKSAQVVRSPRSKAAAQQSDVQARQVGYGDPLGIMAMNLSLPPQPQKELFGGNPLWTASGAYRSRKRLELANASHASQASTRVSSNDADDIQMSPEMDSSAPGDQGFVDVSSVDMYTVDADEDWKDSEQRILRLGMKTASILYNTTNFTKLGKPFSVLAGTNQMSKRSKTHAGLENKDHSGAAHVHRQNHSFAKRDALDTRRLAATGAVMTGHRVTTSKLPHARTVSATDKVNPVHEIASPSKQVEDIPQVIGPHHKQHVVKPQGSWAHTEDTNPEEAEVISAHLEQHVAEPQGSLVHTESINPRDPQVMGPHHIKEHVVEPRGSRVHTESTNPEDPQVIGPHHKQHIVKPRGSWVHTEDTNPEEAEVISAHLGSSVHTESINPQDPQVMGPHHKEHVVEPRGSSVHTESTNPEDPQVAGPHFERHLVEPKDSGVHSVRTNPEDPQVVGLHHKQPVTEPRGSWKHSESANPGEPRQTVASHGRISELRGSNSVTPSARAPSKHSHHGHHGHHGHNGHQGHHGHHGRRDPGSRSMRVSMKDTRREPVHKVKTVVHKSKSVSGSAEQIDPFQEEEKEAKKGKSRFHLAEELAPSVPSHPVKLPSSEFAPLRQPRIVVHPSTAEELHPRNDQDLHLSPMELKALNVEETEGAVIIPESTLKAMPLPTASILTAEGPSQWEAQARSQHVDHPHKARLKAPQKKEEVHLVSRWHNQLWTKTNARKNNQEVAAPQHNVAKSRPLPPSAPLHFSALHPPSTVMPASMEDDSSTTRTTPLSTTLPSEEDDSLTVPSAQENHHAALHQSRWHLWEGKSHVQSHRTKASQEAQAPVPANSKANGVFHEFLGQFRSNQPSKPSDESTQQLDSDESRSGHPAIAMLSSADVSGTNPAAVSAVETPADGPHASLNRLEEQAFAAEGTVDAPPTSYATFALDQAMAEADAETLADAHKAKKGSSATTTSVAPTSYRFRHSMVMAELPSSSFGRQN